MTLRQFNKKKQNTGKFLRMNLFVYIHKHFNQSTYVFGGIKNA